MSMYEERHAEVLKNEVKVINFKKYIKDRCDGKYQPYSEKMALFVNDKNEGICVDYDGVGFECDMNKNSVVEIDLYTCYDEYNKEHPNEHLICCYPIGTTKIKIESLLKEEIESVTTFEEFFTKRNYNDRCASNYENVIKILKKLNIITDVKGARL